MKFSFTRLLGGLLVLAALLAAQVNLRAGSHFSRG